MAGIQKRYNLRFQKGLFAIGERTNPLRIEDQLDVQIAISEDELYAMKRAGFNPDELVLDRMYTQLKEKIKELWDKQQR